MNHTLLGQLPALLPEAVAWASARENEMLLHGRTLTADETLLAERVGVRHPERVRLAEVPQMPWPESPTLSQAALQVGFLGPNTIGLTLGYVVLILAGKSTRRLLAHEFRHVQQYETAGSNAAFLSEYVRQLLTVGYEHAPLELDARAHEAMAFTDSGTP